MIKGINHQVIEVSPTDNKYYDRAFLLVKPEYSSAQRDMLEREAKKMLSKYSTLSSIKRNDTFIKRSLRFLFPMIVGALVTILIFVLFIK